MDIIESLKEQLALAHEQIASLEQEKNDDYAEASSYAMSLYNNYYKNKSDAVDFELCTSVAAVITQIDNMATGRIAELDKLLAGYKQVAKERAEFIINGEELGYISLPESENDKAYLTFIRCQLTDEYAAIEALKYPS